MPPDDACRDPNGSAARGDISGDHGAGADNSPIAYRAPGNHRRADPDQHPFTNLDMATEMGPWCHMSMWTNAVMMIDATRRIQNDIIPNHSTRIDHNASADDNAFPQADVRRQHCGWMDGVDHMHTLSPHQGEKTRPRVVMANSNHNGIMGKLVDMGNGCQHGQPHERSAHKARIIIQKANGMAFYSRFASPRQNITDDLGVAPCSQNEHP
jgi:hypothetical protein